MNNVKIANNEHKIVDILKNRWSARAFSDKTITDEQLNSLFEAARWAASANNEQPWQFMYARNGTEGFKKIWECLMPGNQPWAQNANVLIISIARKTFEANQKDNIFAKHDLGMATANLLSQAIALDIYTHPMAGYDKAALINKIGLGNDQESVCIIAAGFLAHPDTLEEPFKTRELTERARKSIGEFVVAL